MTDTTLPDRLRALADSLECDRECCDEWEHPIDAVETCRAAADEIERLLAVEEAHLHSSADDADTIADYQARHETSLEVIRARERQVESQRVEIERLRDAMTTLRGIIAEKLHLRRCRDCGCEFYATNGAVPYHDCPRCESRHTRRIASRKDAT